jgi:hypothetical protein
LNRRVPPAQLTNETTNRVFLRLTNLIFYNQFTPKYDTQLGIPVSFQMKAGTVVDALNQLAEQAGQVMWVAYARPRDNRYRVGRLYEYRQLPRRLGIRASGRRALQRRR